MEGKSTRSICGMADVAWMRASSKTVAREADVPPSATCKGCHARPLRPAREQGRRRQRSPPSATSAGWASPLTRPPACSEVGAS
jgi:hypothetical protein